MEHNRPDKKSNTISDVGVAMECPFCGNHGADFKSRAVNAEMPLVRGNGGLPKADLDVTRDVSDKAAKPYSSVIMTASAGQYVREPVRKRGLLIWLDVRTSARDDWRAPSRAASARNFAIMIAFMSRHICEFRRLPPASTLALNRFGSTRSCGTRPVRP
jgi:hypothetical protein